MDGESEVKVCVVERVEKGWGEEVSFELWCVMGPRSEESSLT